VPGLYIITGSNGAGKSTVGFSYLPQEIQKNCSVFDGDKLFMEKRKELSKTIPSFKEAKKIAFKWVSETFDFLVDDALAKNENFAYEGHFTNDSPNFFWISKSRALRASCD
jgi:predicted ABC-type ATPase